jgi:hypothetical protein
MQAEPIARINEDAFRRARIELLRELTGHEPPVPEPAESPATPAPEPARAWNALLAAIALRA